ncbi:MAG TPA: hypothetical protein ENK25_02565 [Bacteroidetes bacterium]|nr:hypothetical protein [Bacteroidota bacterium]
MVQADKIYTTRENRRWLKERGIRMTASPWAGLENNLM